MEIIRFLNYEIQIIRQPKRRNLVLTMHPDKNISVKTNNHTNQQQIINFLVIKKKWIEKNINKFRLWNEQFKMPGFCEGACFPYLGELKYLKLTESLKKDIYFKIEDGFLVCYHSKVGGQSLNSEIFFKKLKIFYKSEAEIYLKNRLSEWSKITGLVPLKLSFRSNHTRWGSCSSRQHISLNLKLICQSAVLIDYVLVHELCHLQHLNHSPYFWSLVELYFPSYKEVEKVLQQQVRLGRFLN